MTARITSRVMVGVGMRLGFGVVVYQTIVPMRHSRLAEVTTTPPEVALQPCL